MPAPALKCEIPNNLEMILEKNCMQITDMIVDHNFFPWKVWKWSQSNVAERENDRHMDFQKKNSLKSGKSLNRHRVWIKELGWRKMDSDFVWLLAKNAYWFAIFFLTKLNFDDLKCPRRKDFSYFFFTVVEKKIFMMWNAPERTISATFFTMVEKVIEFWWADVLQNEEFQI